MKKIVLFVILTSLCMAQEKPYRILNSFNAGELSPLLYGREDLAKFQSGCSTLENLIVLPQGGVVKRPGTKYVAGSKSNTKIRLFPFEYSTEQAYILEFGNQYIRFFSENEAVTGGDGTEDLSSLNNILAHWLLNENASNQTVVDDDGATYNGSTVTNNTSVLHADGKVGIGCFALDGRDAVVVSDAAGLSFDDSGSNPFSIAGWAYVASQSQESQEQVIISKWKGGTAREWKLSIDANQKLKLSLFDDSTSLSSSRVAQWKLNDNAANTAVDDAVAVVPHDGVATANTNTLHASGRLGTGCFDLSGSASAQVADHAALSFDDTADECFSLTSWVYVTITGSTQTIISKYDTNAKREWWLYLDAAGKLGLNLHDQSAGKTASRLTDTALTTGWHFVSATYNSAHASWSAATAASYITLYVDGSAVASTATNDAAYAGMEDLAGSLSIGSYLAAGVPQGIFADKIDNTVLFNVALTAAQVSSLYNEGAGVEDVDGSYPYCTSDDSVEVGWRFLAAVYDSTGGATAASGITLYVDGAEVDSTATNDSGYTAMEDTAANLYIGSQLDGSDTIEYVWNDKIDNIAMFTDELTSTEIAALYNSATYEIESPYLTADLFEIKYEQSADVMYITHPDYESRKLSRLAHNTWTLDVLGVDNGPFRPQNTDVAKLIASSATTGNVTLTATGCSPFVDGTTSGHEPSGTADTDKCKTGALFRLVHPVDTLEYHTDLENNYTADQTENVSWMDAGTLYEGGVWTLVTDGTWDGTLEVQRNYTIGAAHDASGWETVLSFSSSDDRNVSTTGTEDVDDASYRVILTATGDAAEDCEIYFSTDQISHVGIVEITNVINPTSASGTVIQTLGSTDATHQWSEGAWSNYRGWPKTVAFFEDRLVMGGNATQPDTIWGSVTGDYENMLEGTDDDDAVIFTLTSGQVNSIQWLVGKVKLLIGTSGAEWSLGGSGDEPLTPSNVKAAQQSTYGSADMQANLASESVLFIQRNARKMREMAYNWELDSYISPDMMILNPSVSGDGITDTAYQQTPESVLWCIRDDGQLLGFSYERKEAITAWHRHITDGEFESVAVISGPNEAQVWLSVKREIGGSDKRYIEYIAERDFGTDVNDAYFVDCGITDTGGSTTVSGLSHLEGETLIVLGDGAEQTEASSGDFTVSSGSITVPSGLTTVHAGLPYTCKLETMPLSYLSNQTVHGRVKRINEVIVDFYRSGDFYIGRDTTNKELISLDGMESSEDVERDTNRITFPLGYDRIGKILVYQYSPEPLTLIALMVEFLSY